MAALLAVLTSVVVIVIPGAIGGTEGAPIPPPTMPQNVTPTLKNVGGSNFSCAPGLVRFSISKAVTGSYTDPATNVTFTITNPPAGAPIGTGANQVSSKEAKNYFTFTVSGGRVYDLGVNGGTDTAWYSFPGGVGSSGTGALWPAQTVGGVSYPNGLTALHATRDNKNSLYVASITTFCYLPTYVKVNGTVFQDTNESTSVVLTSGGAVAAPDLPLPGWTVTLYRDGVSLGTRTTDANGYYEFADVLASGTELTVCETAPSGSWFQTTPTTTKCSSPLTKGHGFALASVNPGDVLTGDFGNVPTVTSTCGNTVSYPTATGSYQVRLAGTTGKCNGQYVLLAYTDGAQQVAHLHQIQSTSSRVEVVEKIVWSGYPNTQNSVTLSYDDSYGNTVTKTEMKFCNFDPRKVTGGVTSEFELGSSTSGVLPAGTTNDPTTGFTTHTSCLISATLAATATSGTNNKVYTAYVYSSVDGLRFDQ